MDGYHSKKNKLERKKQGVLCSVVDQCRLTHVGSCLSGGNAESSRHTARQHDPSSTGSELASGRRLP